MKTNEDKFELNIINSKNTLYNPGDIVIEIYIDDTVSGKLKVYNLPYTNTFICNKSKIKINAPHNIELTDSVNHINYTGKIIDLNNIKDNCIELIYDNIFDTVQDNLKNTVNESAKCKKLSIEIQDITGNFKDKDIIIIGYTENNQPYRCKIDKLPFYNEIKAKSFVFYTKPNIKLYENQNDYANTVVTFNNDINDDTVNLSLKFEKNIILNEFSCTDSTSLSQINYDNINDTLFIHINSARLSFMKRLKKAILLLFNRNEKYSLICKNFKQNFL